MGGWRKIFFLLNKEQSMKKENHVAFIQFKLFWYDEREGKTENRLSDWRSTEREWIKKEVEKKINKS